MQGHADERGVALIVALMAMLLLTALGLALVLSTTTETMIAGSYRNGQEALYAAEAGIERSMPDLLAVPDWSAIPAGNMTSAFIDGPPSGSRTLPDGASLDLTQATNLATCGKTSECSLADINASTDDRPWGQSNPRWRLYAYGPINQLLPTGMLSSAMYVVVWVGNHQLESGNDPAGDGSSQTDPGREVLAIRAEAFGPSGSRRVVEVAIARTRSVENERGQDE
jgi:Tfp pilus assembly protein PilX